jgi:hypothetical protein
MGIVNIAINVVNGTVQTPPRGNANRSKQQIVWTISNPPGSGITFNDPPVVFPSPPPAGYSPWAGTAVTAGPGPNQYQANVNQLVPVGSPELLYKYDIVWTTGSLDPDIGNQGYPPGSDDDDDDQGDQGDLNRP